MELIDLLKRLAEKYPEKWRMVSNEKYNQHLFRSQTDVSFVFDPYEYFTEDIDRILAEHGLVMWVSVGSVNLNPPYDYWFGRWSKPCTMANGGSPQFPTKREATLATFRSALEYLMEEK